jgi:amino acid adenylation domain-containing protein
MIATVPVRVNIDQTLPVDNFLKKVQTQATEMINYEQFGIQNIGKLSADASEACDVSSLLVIQPFHQMFNKVNGGDDDEDDALFVPLEGDQNDEEGGFDNYFSYPLVIQGQIADSYINLQIIYNANILDDEQMDTLSHQYIHVARQLFAQDSKPLSELSIAAERDFEQAKDWNSEVPELIDATFHELVEKHAKLSPSKLALRAHDGDFTYSEYDAAANRLANYIIEKHGVSVGDLVHVCFEKSLWHFVAILAINKAGAAWVPLDPSHPEQRQKQVVGQTGATLALASPSNSKLCGSLLSAVVEVSADLDTELSKNQAASKAPAVKVSPRNAAYVLFTSGSTGTPKGLVMEHGSVCTSQTAIGKRLGLTSEVNMLQFAAFVFDLSIGEIVGPLITGATISIPSEHTRLNNLTAYMNEMNITWSYLTPAFARTLDPKALPKLELLLFAGEAVGRDVFESWFGHVTLANGWGPAETCCFSTIHIWQSLEESPLNIGRPVGGFCWIVDPNNPHRLAPTGTLGEVVIQGPTILREYLADPKRTAETVVTTLPDWAPLQESDQWRRFYKSGDLCSYNSDGTILFSSRKDTQVKIRGLRVELGEVEHHVRTQLPGVSQVAVDVFKGDRGTSLVAYFTFNKDTQTSSEELFLPLTPELQRQLSAMVGELRIALPRYMVPSLFIPCRYMPFITSTKLDRNGLRSRLSKLTQADLEAYSLLNTEKRAPDTALEIRLARIWSQLLGITEENIGKDDAFLQIGGDSILAIQLVSQARELGISLTAKDIFDDSRLSVIATKAVEIDAAEVDGEIEPFSLLTASQREAVNSEAVRQKCALSESQEIEDAYPTTPIQEGLIALAEKQPGSHIAKYVYKLSDFVDVDRFKSAWERTLQLCGNLRTRIVQVEGDSIQLLVKDDVLWESNTTDAGAFVKESASFQMGYGSRLSRYALIQEGPKENYFVWVIHHSIYDGWSSQLVLRTLFNCYSDSMNVGLFPYSGFIKYTQSITKEASQAYWSEQLANATRSAWPPTAPKAGTKAKNVTKVMVETIDFQRASNSAPRGERTVVGRARDD